MRMSFIIYLNAQGWKCWGRSWNPEVSIWFHGCWGCNLLDKLLFLFKIQFPWWLTIFSINDPQSCAWSAFLLRGVWVEDGGCGFHHTVQQDPTHRQRLQGWTLCFIFWCSVAQDRQSTLGKKGTRYPFFPWIRRRGLGNELSVIRRPHLYVQAWSSHKGLKNIN